MIDAVMSISDIQHVIAETRTWTTYLAVYLVLGLLALTFLVFAPAGDSSLPVFFFLLVSLGQLHGIRKRLADLQDALKRAGS